jgi:hypothetical protein
MGAFTTRRGAFSAKTRCSALCVSSLDLFLFRRTPLFYLHSACRCLLDTVVLEQCVVVDQSLSEGHCTLFMQSMSLLCPDPSSLLFQTKADIIHTAIEKLYSIALCMLVFRSMRYLALASIDTSYCDGHSMML